MQSVPRSPEGSIFLDARGGDRVLKVSWHHEAGVVVLSLWRENVCAATFRVEAQDVAAVVEALQSGLDGVYDVAFDAAAGSA